MFSDIVRRTPSAPQKARVSGVFAFKLSDRGLTFESLTLAYNAAISGAGVAIAIRTFVANDLATGRLIKPFDHVRKSKSGFNIVYSAERLQKFKKINSFRAWLLEERAREIADELARGAT